MLKLISVIFLSGCCLVFHTILIMIQASTLNVAFNSHNKSLLTIMMSSNVSKNTHMKSHIYCGINVFVLHVSVFLFSPLQQFVEIKGSVFKKFGKNNLFQMSNSGKIFSEIFPWMGNNPSWSTCSSCCKWNIYSFFILCILMKSEEGKCGSTHTALQKSVHLTWRVEHIVLFYFHYLIPYIFISFLFLIFRH